MSSAFTMAVANVWKGLSIGGGSILLSCCCGHQMLSNHSQLKLNANRPSPFCGESLKASSLFLSQFLPFECDKSAMAATSVTVRRLFCNCTSSSSPNVADSFSAVQTTTPSEASTTSDDLTAIKNAANTLELRVGKILRAWRHEEADTLYVEEVDVGEPQPRIICSGLVKYMPLDHLRDKKVIVLANLKPRNMRGVKSFGMLMAASDASHENVELLEPPEDSLPGERVWFGSAEEKDELPDFATANQIQKKKIWELVQPHLRTDSSCVAVLDTHLMRTSSGVVMCSSVQNGNVS